MFHVLNFEHYVSTDFMPFETIFRQRKFSVINLLKTRGFACDFGHCTLTLRL